jgi:hypothetical protein
VIRLQFIAIFYAVGLAGCGSSESEESRVELEGQVVEVACGQCIYRMDGTDGLSCPWSAEVAGEHYLISGSVPKDHHKHDADGICSMEREARVTGYVHNEYLVVSAFELLPAKDVPEGAAEHEHDHEH